MPAVLCFFVKCELVNKKIPYVLTKHTQKQIRKPTKIFQLFLCKDLLEWYSNEGKESSCLTGANMCNTPH